MNRTSKSLRLTERDIEYITWIAEQQAVRLDTLQLLFEIKGKRSLLGIVRKCKTSAYEFLSLWENLWESAFAVGRNY